MNVTCTLTADWHRIGPIDWEEGGWISALFIIVMMMTRVWVYMQLAHFPFRHVDCYLSILCLPDSSSLLRSNFFFFFFFTDIRQVELYTPRAFGPWSSCSNCDNSGDA